MVNDPWLIVWALSTFILYSIVTAVAHKIVSRIVSINTGIWHKFSTMKKETRWYQQVAWNTTLLAGNLCDFSSRIAHSGFILNHWAGHVGCDCSLLLWVIDTSLSDLQTVSCACQSGCKERNANSLRLFCHSSLSRLPPSLDRLL